MPELEELLELELELDELLDELDELDELEDELLELEELLELGESGSVGVLVVPPHAANKEDAIIRPINLCNCCISYSWFGSSKSPRAMLQRCVAATLRPTVLCLKC